MKNKKALPIAILMTVLLAACETKHIENGLVVERWYEPASETTRTVYRPVSFGKSVISMPFTETVYDDEDFCITISGVIDGERTTELVKLNADLYRRVQVGDSAKRFEGNLYFTSTPNASQQHTQPGVNR